MSQCENVFFTIEINGEIHFTTMQLETRFYCTAKDVLALYQYFIACNQEDKIIDR